MEGQTMNKSSLLTIQRVSETETTVPIRRSTIADTVKNKQHYSYSKPQLPNSIIEHALAVYTAPGQIFGAEATINIWNPFIETKDEFSLAQMSIIFGVGGNTFTLEAGWHVLPSLYGDTNTRFYTFWTGSTGETGCYNYFCKGLEMYSEIVGSPLTVSTVDSVQSQIIIQIRRALGAHWWLYIDGNAIGYWLRDNFHHLKDGGSHVEWGGKVSNTRPDNRHTRTAMGSGRFPREGYLRASYFNNLRVEELEDLQPLPYERLSLHVTNENCYSISLAPRFTPGSDFFYGGLGFNHACP